MFINVFHNEKIEYKGCSDLELENNIIILL